MPWKQGTTIQGARAEIARFLQETGCYDTCAACPVYPGGEGCCQGCPQLMKNPEGKVLGCGSPNLSCLSYTCGVLNEKLRRQGRLEEFITMVYPLPREGYRGCQRREDHSLLQISDPLGDLVAEVQIGIPSGSVKEETGE